MREGRAQATATTVPLCCGPGITDPSARLSRVRPCRAAAPRESPPSRLSAGSSRGSRCSVRPTASPEPLSVCTNSVFAAPSRRNRMLARRAWNASHVAARRDLAVGALAGQPDLDVVGLGRGEAHVARAEQHRAVRQAEPLQDLLGVARQALELVVRLLGRARTSPARPCRTGAGG